MNALEIGVKPNMIMKQQYENSFKMLDPERLFDQSQFICNFLKWEVFNNGY